jgi:murein DD-endopeptidase MepM/ murein hydrolase activator NlpD
VQRTTFYMKRDSAARDGLISVRSLLAVVAVALMTGGMYVCLPAGFLSSFPFACSIPAPNLPDDSSDSLLPSQGADAPDADTPNGSQEIAELTGPGETLLSLLNATLDDTDAARRVATSLAGAIRSVSSKPFGPHAVLESGRRYSITLDSEGRFLQMTLELDPADVFHAVSEGDSIRSWKEEVVLDFKVETITFPVRGSLSESVLRAGEGIELAVKLLNVFKWDIDFQAESKRGDICKVLFERRYADDRASGYGRVLCAVYNGKKTGRKIAVLFNNVYYDEKGVELKKDLLRSPLSVVRVTSKFGMRFHPIRKEFHVHQGVDYGAPLGTQVRAVASGIVTFAGWKGDYGNFVCVRHENGRESRYGHLYRIFVRKGQRIKQAQRIGLVGRTGLATGPHLHFELLVGGKHVNPLAVHMLASVRSVPGPLKSRFQNVAQQRLLRLQGVALGGTYTPENVTSFD